MARYGDLDSQYFDDAGDPLISGKVYFYETGTTTLKTTYSDVNLTIPNTNPVILTAAGRQPNIFFDGVAKAILTTSANVQILVRDPVGQTTSAFGDAWVSSKIYSANDVVQGSDGEFYVSLAANNVNNNPASTSGFWVLMYSIDWNSGITYTEGAVVTVSNLLYQSLQNSNLNKNPTTEATYWRLISLAYVSTITYTVGQNVVGPDGIFYTALRTTIGDTPASSPSDWVGTSAAAAASASAALASQVAAAASAVSASSSASTATTQASNASTSASTATTQAGNASTSAATATTQAGISTTQAGIATTQAGIATTQASNAAASAVAAAASAASIGTTTGTGDIVRQTSPTLVTPALGTPSALVVTNATGTASININGTVGATTPGTGAFTTLSATGNASVGIAAATAVTGFDTNRAVIQASNSVSDNGQLRLGAAAGFMLDHNTGGNTTSTLRNLYGATSASAALNIESGTVVIGAGTSYTAVGTFTSTGLAVTGAISATELITASKGIVFPATQVASAGANTLDDYEEGSWTPEIGTTGGSSTGRTYSAQTGTYTKIGNIVTVNFTVTLSAKGTGSGNPGLGGLPFAMASSRDHSSSMYFSDLGASWINIHNQGRSGQTLGYFVGRKSAGTSSEYMSGTDFPDLSDTTSFSGTFTYTS
jgi:hypothetical protein